MRNNFIQESEYCPRVLPDPKNKLAMYWSPKAGCSIIARMFLIHINSYDHNRSCIKQRDEYTKNIKQTHKDKADFLSHMPNQDKQFYKNFFNIQLVRNPYSRAVSSFIKYLHQAQNNLTLSFQSFLELIIIGNSTRWGRKSRSFLEHHFLPQYMIDCDFIIKIENIVDDLALLKKTHGLDLDYNDNEVEPSYQSGKYTTKDSDTSCSVAPFRFTSEHNGLINMQDLSVGIPEYKLFYNQYCKDMVEKIYGKDIDFFNYDFPFDINLK
jgi:hypothetical protein